MVLICDVFYDLLEETETHVFFVCFKATKCWKQIGLHSLVQELLLTTNNFSTMIFHLLNRYRLAPQQQSLVDMVLWSLWKNCNSKLWKSLITPHVGTVKCNVDAVSFNNNPIMECNMCFRDSLDHS